MSQQDSLTHAKPVLLINHGKAKIVIGDAFRDQRMRADDDLRAAVCQCLEHGFAVAAAALAKQKVGFHAQRCEKGVDAGMMLAR